MNIRQAILKTAALFEARPELFNFSRTRKPDCQTPGCALGWIGVYAGVREQHDGWMRSAAAFAETTPIEFYNRMTELWADRYRGRLMEVGTWQSSASLCAEMLRLYADKYHPAEQPSMPDSVRAIFSMTHEQLRRELA